MRHNGIMAYQGVAAEPPVGPGIIGRLAAGLLPISVLDPGLLQRASSSKGSHHEAGLEQVAHEVSVPRGADVATCPKHATSACT